MRLHGLGSGGGAAAGRISTDRILLLKSVDLEVKRFRENDSRRYYVKRGGGGRCEAGAGSGHDPGRRGDGGRTTRTRKTEERKEEGRTGGARLQTRRGQICSRADQGAAASGPTSLLSDATIENNYGVR